MPKAVQDTGHTVVERTAIINVQIYLFLQGTYLYSHLILNIGILNSMYQDIVKVMKSRDLPPRLLYPAKLSFRMEGQIKCFPDKKTLKEFIITKPLL